MSDDDEKIEAMKHLLHDWPQLARTSILLTLFFCLLFAGVIGTLYVFRSSGLSIKTTDTGTAIQFNDLDKSVRFDTLLIHPRDWNDPEIQVKEGDSISLSAYGSVNVAAGLLNKSLAKQYEHRDANEEQGIGRDVGLMNDAQVKESLLIVPWNGPEGFRAQSIKAENVKETHNKEAKNRIIPNEEIGRLVVAIVPGVGCPSKGETRSDFDLRPYHDKMIFTSKMDGSVCFVVNDQRTTDDNRNQLFWDDNLGFFAVNLKIVSK